MKTVWIIEDGSRSRQQREAQRALLCIRHAGERYAKVCVQQVDA